MIQVRPLRLDDSAALAVLLAQDRDYLRAWDPARPAGYFTEAGQRAVLAGHLDEVAAGRMWAGTILDDGRIAGRIALNNILRGPLQCCFLGYWVAQAFQGRGVATEAAAQTLRIAFGELGLHRVDAFARADNPASCRVLERNGFERMGLSRGHVHIDGRWRDDIFFQLLAPWDDGVRLGPAGAPAR